MSYDFLENERQLSLEDIIMEMQKEILRLRDKINSYEQKLKDMELEDMIESKESKENNFYGHTEAMKRMNEFFKKQNEEIEREQKQEQAKTCNEQRS